MSRTATNRSHRGPNQSGCSVQKRLEADHRRRVRTDERALAALRARCNCHRCVARRERGVGV